MTQQDQTGVHEIAVNLAQINARLDRLATDVNKLSEAFARLLILEERHLQVAEKIESVERRLQSNERELSTWRTLRILLAPIALAFGTGIGMLLWDMFRAGAGS